MIIPSSKQTAEPNKKQFQNNPHDKCIQRLPFLVLSRRKGSRISARRQSIHVEIVILSIRPPSFSPPRANNLWWSCEWPRTLRCRGQQRASRIKQMLCSKKSIPCCLSNQNLWQDLEPNLSRQQEAAAEWISMVFCYVCMYVPICIYISTYNVHSCVLYYLCFSYHFQYIIFHINWFSMLFNYIQWLSMIYNDFQWFSFISIDFQWFSMIFNDYDWFSYVFNDFQWFSFIFIDFHWF